MITIRNGEHGFELFFKTLWRHEQADNDLKFREENLSRLQGTIHDQRGEHRSKLQDLHAERSAINKLYRDAEMNVAKVKKVNFMSF